MSSFKIYILSGDHPLELGLIESLEKNIAVKLIRTNIRELSFNEKEKLILLNLSNENVQKIFSFKIPNSSFIELNSSIENLKENSYLKIDLDRLSLNYGGLEKSGILPHEVIQKISKLHTNTNLLCIELCGLDILKRCLIKDPFIQGADNFFLILNLLINKITEDFK